MFFKLSKWFLYATAFMVALVSLSTLFPFIVGKYVFFRTAVDLSLIFFLLGLVFDEGAAPYVARLKQIVRSPLFIAISAFTAIFLLAGFFGIDPAWSFWSNFERGEGGIQILHLYAFFVLLATLFREEGEWKRMLWFTVIGSALMIVYGLLAGAHIGNFVGSRFGEEGYRFQGSIGNPAYVAAYLLFTFFYTLVLAVRSGAFRDRMKGIGFGVLLAAFLVMFIQTGTRAAFLALIAGALTFFAYLGYARPRWRKWMVSIGLALVVVVALLVQFRHVPVIAKLPGARVLDISATAETFSTRTEMWSIAWNAWKDRPLLGYGPENFLKVFDKYYDPSRYIPSQGFGAWYDRAHSIIFDYLAETGILGLLAFLSMFGALALLFRRPLPVRWGGESRESVVLKGLFLALPVAYLVQGVILFDVLTIYWNLFLFLAFSVFVFMPQEEKIEKYEPGSVSYGLALAGILLAVLACYFGSMLPYGKARSFIQAERNSGKIGSLKQFEDNFDPALNFKSPVGGEEIPKFLSNDVVNVLPSLSESPEVASALVAYIEPYMLKNDVRHLMVLAQMHYALLRFTGDEAEFKATEDAFKKAHEIGPNLPQPMYGLLALYTNTNKKQAAAEQKNEILKLWPNAFATSTTK
jgi:O-antigen ligase